MSTSALSKSASARSLYVNDEAIDRTATDQDVHDLGLTADRALQKLALDTGKYCRDEAILALLVLVESVFYLKGRRATHHDSLARPALDYIIPCYPDSRSASQIGFDALQLASPWMRPSHDYSSLVGGILNYFQGRMRCAITTSGRLVFYPISSFPTELRNRWFDLRRYRLLEQKGIPILEDNSQTRAIVALIDRDVAAQEASILQSGIYTPPTAAWYTQHTDGLVDRALPIQFAHIGDNEVWGGLRKEQVIKAVRPLYLRATRRLFGHIRVYTYLSHRYGAGGPMISLIEIVDLTQLTAEISSSAGIAAPMAETFAKSLLRTGREERFPVENYPLIPLSGNRAVFLPSAVLFSNWPAFRERMAMKTKAGHTTVNRARDQRHTASLSDAAKAAGFQHVGVAIEVLDPATKQALTDLDVVVVNDACSMVLVVQLKSFLTPMNLLEFDKADDSVQEAYAQCARADANRDAVRTAIQARLGITLTNGWSLKHIVVVEAVTGTLPPHPDYPAVSLEWLTTQLTTSPPIGLNELWDAAVNVPDGRAFFGSVAPAFELFDDHLRDLKLGKSATVFAYASDGRD